MWGRAARVLTAAAVLVGAAACSHSNDVSSPTTSRPRPTSTSVATTRAPHAFESAVEPVTATDLSASWRPGCPLPVGQLRLLRVSHWGFDGRVHEGRLVVDEAVVDDVTAVFQSLFDAQFPIEKMEPVDVYGGSDDASGAANNTSAFNCRLATGGTGWSQHAYGRAIDVNPVQNPYLRGDVVLPVASARFLDRTRSDEGMIHYDDAAVRAFAAIGWPWGGRWSTLKDYQHFSLTGR